MTVCSESDLFSRLLRDRPDAITAAALLSWLVGGALAGASWAIEDFQIGRFWPLLILPIVLTMLAATALIQRDPERAGMDAFRSASLAAVPSALLVGAAAVRGYETLLAGQLATVCMAAAVVGSAVGALCGPVLGWAWRSILRTTRALIRRVVR